jgi:hypothetical protein
VRRATNLKIARDESWFHFPVDLQLRTMKDGRNAISVIFKIALTHGTNYSMQELIIVYVERRTSHAPENF